jgi:hypothetical protein
MTVPEVQALAKLKPWLRLKVSEIHPDEQMEILH